MKNLLKRTLGLVLVLTLLATMMMPGAFAAKSKPVTNPTKFKDAEFWTFTGLTSTLSLVDSAGLAVSNSNYKWSTSKKSVVTVNKSGVITAQKTGKATITATNKKNKKDKCKIVVHVQKNKVDNIYPQPTTSMVSYGNFGILLKSVEIASPKKVVCEYYVAFNFPAKRKVTKITYVEDAINLFNRSTGAFVKTIVGDEKQLKAKKISGFKTRKGAFVQVIKVTYTGKRVHCANIKLADYIVDGSQNVKAKCRYYK